MIEQCPLCKHTGFQPYLTATDHLGKKEEFTVVRCRCCNFLFTIDAPDVENIGRYYESPAYESLTGKRSFFRAQIRSLRQKHAARMIEKITGLHSGNILDIGCGTGDFLHLLSSRGWNVIGVEPDGRCRMQSELDGIHVLTPQELSTIPDASMDVITLWHVLEHVHDLRNAGYLIRRLLKPQGYCILAVPNAEAFDAKLYGKHWHGYELPRHLYHFTRQTIAKFAEQSKLKITRMSSMPLDSIYCCLKSEEYCNGSSLRGLLRSFLTLAISLVRPSSSTTILVIMRHRR